MNTLTLTPVGQTMRGSLVTDHGMYMVEIVPMDIYYKGSGELNKRILVEIREMFGLERFLLLSASDLRKAVETLFTLQQNDERLVDPNDMSI